MKVALVRKLGIFLLTTVMLSCHPKEQTKQIVTQEKPSYAIVIHGGAGTITRENLSAEKEKEYRAALNAALDIGEGILKSGGSAIDAVQKTINLMEDSPLFNAGKGAVFTNAGTNELDASIMEGENQNAGAVGGVKTVKNPINAARAVMEKSDHVFMASTGADEFAKSQNLEIVDPSYFYTERRFNSLQRVLGKETTELSESDKEIKKRGTVGCVALDKDGNIVAGTSTGGMTNKKFGRVGDSPIIGAGTFANNATCGVSATGHGEFFIRYTVARDIAAMMEYGGKSLAEASEYIINVKLVKKGGSGGIIALDQYGNISMPFNTEGMYRGWAKSEEREVLIYKN
jgi:beta-aspartyl-peptidase (threonine type)